MSRLMRWRNMEVERPNGVTEVSLIEDDLMKPMEGEAINAAGGDSSPSLPAAHVPKSGRRLIARAVNETPLDARYN